MEKVNNKRFCLLLAYDFPEKIKIHYNFSSTQPNQEFIWRVSKFYRPPEKSPYPVYFFHHGIINYRATCKLCTTQDSNKADINLVPPEYRSDKTEMKTWFILENLEPCDERRMENFRLYTNPESVYQNKKEVR